MVCLIVLAALLILSNTVDCDLNAVLNDLNRVPTPTNPQNNWQIEKQTQQLQQGWAALSAALDYTKQHQQQLPTVKPRPKPMYPILPSVVCRDGHCLNSCAPGFYCYSNRHTCLQNSDCIGEDSCHSACVIQVS
uniref:Uncharacterized protein n=1 Tax=Spodoptera litura male-killing virus TaxID=2996810 RepID=A0AA86IZJ9_9VIRU|nr:hypothetical protein [Spodoptera litura male-killing virus]